MSIHKENTENTKLMNSGESSYISSKSNSNFDNKRSFSNESARHEDEEFSKKTETSIYAYQKFSFNINESPGRDETPSVKQTFDQNTPHSGNPTELITCKRTISDGELCGTPGSSQQSCDIPLPPLPWANNVEVWQTMVYTEEAASSTRSCRLFEAPYKSLPRMRAILLDWIMEVCEKYQLRRVTYYLAVDYIDRYLTINPDVSKNLLQLLGISSLFIAAKLEETCAPRLNLCSYVCDNIYSDEDILECELMLLNTLNWDLNPMTTTGWLNLYMQIYFKNIKYRKDDKCEEEKEESEDSHFLYPQYSAMQFVFASHIIDLFSLDPSFLLFNYNIIAAGAMHFIYGRNVALQVSGLSWDNLKDCIQYMAVFYEVIRDAHDPGLQTIQMGNVDTSVEATYRSLKVWIPELLIEEHHLLQTHVVDLKYFEKAIVHRLERMGFRVRKAYFKKKNVPKLDELDNSSNLTESAEELVEVDLNEESSISLFEIEKSLESEYGSETVSSIKCETNNISYFSSKTKYTIDEVLVGINDYIKLHLFHKRQ